MVLLDVPSLRQLRAFEAVARLESVSNAARKVNLSQPALTQSLHALEATLRTRLFERRRSGSYPTELGVILVPRVRRFFDHICSALAESQLNDERALAVLPFHSSHLSRVDGVATQLDWQPTSIHRQFLDLLRAQARALTSVSRVGYGRRSPVSRPPPWGTKTARRKQSARRRPSRLRVQ